MAKKKKTKKSISPSIIHISEYSPPKPKINDKTVSAMQLICNDPGLARLNICEMKSMIEAYKAGKKAK